MSDEEEAFTIFGYEEEESKPRKRCPKCKSSELSFDELTHTWHCDNCGFEWKK